MTRALFINLSRNTDRRRNIESSLTIAGLSGQRIDAVDGDKLRQRARHMSPAELGCYLSHIKAWRTLLESRERHVLVVEDDAVIPPSLGSTILMTLGRLPATWDIVYLYGADGRAVRPLARLDQLRQIVRYSRVPAGAVAYLISRAGAEKLLRQSMGAWPVDTELRRPWRYGLDFYGVSPAPIQHSGAYHSDIATRKRSRRGLRPNPLHTPRAVIWNIKQLGFRWWLRCLWLNAWRRGRRDLAPRRVIRKAWLGASNMVWR
jgi:glycosyl transferase family 25